MRTINRPGLTVPSMFKMSTWDVKEPPHHSKRVRRKVLGVVAVLLSSKCGRFGDDVLKRLAVYDATYAKTATSQKGALPSARQCKITFEQFPAVHLLGILKNRSPKTTEIHYNIYYNFGTLLCLST